MLSCVTVTTVSMVIIIVQHLTGYMSVMRMMNCRCKLFVHADTTAVLVFTVLHYVSAIFAVVMCLCTCVGHMLVLCHIG